MPAKIFSATNIGLEARLIEVETEVSYGLPRFTIVGLPDKAVEESKDRVEAAIKNSGFNPPSRKPTRVLISLAPADLKKEGSLYDLPIALGFLLANKQIDFNPAARILMGELSLSGKLKPIKGALSFALLAKDLKFKEIILPKANGAEAAMVNDIDVIALDSLIDVAKYLCGQKLFQPIKTNTDERVYKSNYPLNMGWIKGQNYAKRALEIAAAGGHNLFMQGPPGTGKTLLAQTLPSILPPLTFDESLEVTKIYSIAGLLADSQPLITLRPFRSPHHTSSEVALLGGGNPPRPGEITLAHRGVLFLDEFPEFHRDVLESLRQPIEEGKITLLRSRHSLSLPARFMLISAANPCPCGYWRNPEKQCSCQPGQIANYRRKLSGPLMDRFDIFIDVPQVKYERLEEPDEENLSEIVRERVTSARLAQQDRFKTDGILTNAEMNLKQIGKYCEINRQAKNLVRKFIDSGNLSVRGYHRVLKTARTISDLAGSEKIMLIHFSEALSYRLKEENR